MDLAAALHRLVVDVCLQPILQGFEGLATFEHWRRASVEDTFSLSPANYITKVGEQLLTLPQQLEPFAVEVRREEKAGGASISFCRATRA